MLPTPRKDHRSYWDDLTCLKFGAVMILASIVGALVVLVLAVLFA
jgi:hypothetical protein